jgi:hypothetical protein
VRPWTEFNWLRIRVSGRFWRQLLKWEVHNKFNSEQAIDTETNNLVGVIITTSTRLFVSLSNNQSAEVSQKLIIWCDAFRLRQMMFQILHRH